MIHVLLLIELSVDIIITPGMLQPQCVISLWDFPIRAHRRAPALLSSHRIRIFQITDQFLGNFKDFVDHCFVVGNGEYGPV